MRARLGGDAQVARRGDHRAGAGHRAVQGADDRPPAAQHGENDIAGLAGEVEQPAIVTLEEGADDVLDVAAGAERLARRR